MKFEIKQDRENPFLKRRELLVDITHEKEPTPTKAALQKLLSAQLNIEPTHVEIDKIFSKKGISYSEAKIRVWKEPIVKDLGKEIKEKQKTEQKETKEEKVEEKPKEKSKENIQK